MRAFWDRAAEDNPLWYVHSGLAFDHPDQAEFFASGEREVESALQDAGLTGGSFAVDIGVGAARLTRALASRFERVWACDVSPRMVEVALGNVRDKANVEIVAVDGSGGLPLSDQVADLVLTLQVLQHIPSRAASLRYVTEAGRILKPGGKAIFHFRSTLRTDPILGTLELAGRHLLEAARRRKTPPPENLDSPAWRGARIGLWQLKRAANKGGLVVAKHRWISRQGASLLVVAEKSR